MRINLKSAIYIFIIPAFLLLCLSTLAHAELESEGQAIVIDPGVGTGSLGALFIVDLRNGTREIISDFGNPDQGPLGDDPTGVALENFYNAIVTEQDIDPNDRGALFRVSLRSGMRELISDFNDPAQGPLGQEPRGVAVDGPYAYVLDSDAGTDLRGLLFHVDLTSGDREIISDFGNPAQGPIGSNPISIVLDGIGGAFVVGDEGGTNNDGTLFHVDLTSGNRMLISDFGNPAQGPIGNNPVGVTLDDSGNVLVSDEDGPPIADSQGVLFRVDPQTGQREIVSNFNDPAQGPLGTEPQGITTDSLGQALVLDENIGTNADGALFIVDVNSGERVMISDFSSPEQGPIGDDPIGIAYRSNLRNVPTLSEWGLIAMAGALGIIGTMVIRRRKTAV